jgi:hypothetical protein
MVRSLLFFLFTTVSFFSPLQASTPVQTLNGVSVALQPDGTATVPALCFVKNQCVYEEILIVASDQSNGLPPSSNSTSIEVDCELVGVLLVEIWAKDFLQEWSVAETYVITEDPFDNCANPTTATSDYVIAKNGLSYAVNADGEVVIHVDDFIAAYSYPPDQSEPTFSFSTDLSDTIRILDCTSEEIVILDIYSHNGEGLPIYTPTYCVLYLNSAPCNGSDPNCCSSSFSINNGLAISLAPEQTFVLKAEDLVNNHPEDVVHFAFSADPADTIRLFNCMDYEYDPTTLLSIYGFGQDGNYSQTETYILIQDYFNTCENTFTGSPNGNACLAYDITNQIDACQIYGHNINAFTQSFEPAPPFGDCEGFNSWCTGPFNTAWFYFDAPASGSVNIYSSCLATQLALWETDNCTQLTSGSAILVAAAANADGSPASLEGISCLIPGNRYYLAVDGQDMMTGPFELIIEDANIDCFIGDEPTLCGGASPEAPVDAIISWQHLFADDNGARIASIANYFSPLGEITAEYLIHDGPVRLDSDGLPYLDRNWTINVGTQPTGNVLLRLYFTASEFQALQAADASIDSADDLLLNRVEGGSCGPFDGASILYSPANSGTIGSTYFVEYEIPGFSSFYLSSAGLVNSTTDKYPVHDDIILSPNPARDIVNIIMPETPYTGADVSLYDNRGKLVKQSTLNNGQLLINDLLPGVYYLKIQTERKAYSKRLLIK